VAPEQTAGPGPKPLRLFIAADIPDSVKTSLSDSVAPFRNRIPGARWTGSDGWHVTLKFLGATWPRLLAEIEGAAARVAGSVHPFRSRLTRLGVFPGPNRARVVWAGLEDRQGRFGSIVAGLDEALEEHFTPESRAFTPHLTVARLTPPRNIREFAPELPDTDVRSAPFTVDRLVLYRSHLSPRGATYEPMEEFPLSG